MSGNNSTPLRAVGYGRASTDQQDESVSDQRAWVGRVSRLEGLTLERFFEDDGVCGDVMDRPGLKAMLDFVDAEFFANRQLDALVVWDTDRVSRATAFQVCAACCPLLFIIPMTWASSRPLPPAGRRQ